MAKTATKRAPARKTTTTKTTAARRAPTKMTAKANPAAAARLVTVKFDGKEHKITSPDAAKRLRNKIMKTGTPTEKRATGALSRVFPEIREAKAPAKPVARRAAAKPKAAPKAKAKAVPKAKVRKPPAKRAAKRATVAKITRRR